MRSTSLQWREVHKGKPADIRRAYVGMHDANLAVVSAFEMVDGEFRVVYSRLGDTLPTVIEKLPSLAMAQQAAEATARQVMLVPRRVLWDA